ncbi:MAG: hypothetical protein WC901_01225 [Candidatus Margulisiibacteriota bacterium]
MDRQSETNVMQALNQFAVASYVQHLLIARYTKITLFSAMPFTGAANVSDAVNILILKEMPSLFALFGKNAEN